MEPEHENLKTEYQAHGKAVSVTCGECGETATASFFETNNPAALAEERLFVVACKQQ